MTHCTVSERELPVRQQHQRVGALARPCCCSSSSSCTPLLLRRYPSQPTVYFRFALTPANCPGAASLQCFCSDFNQHAFNVLFVCHLQLLHLCTHMRRVCAQRYPVAVVDGAMLDRVPEVPSTCSWRAISTSCSSNRRYSRYTL